MPPYLNRAPKDEIFTHLENALGQEATQIVIQVTSLLRAGETDTALKALKTFDATLGGIGVFMITNKRPQGVYRALAYVEMPLRNPGAENYTRFIIQAACGYLEELLKYVVRTWPWEKIKSEGLPLGALVKKATKHLPTDLANELSWLSSKVYNFAKHEYNLTDDYGEQQPAHYFQLDEAIAVYLIVRQLGLRLEKLTGKLPEQLMREQKMDNLEAQFHHAMIGVADFANQHHFGNIFRQMIDEHGAVEAAKRLLTTRDIQTGLMRLWEMKSLSKSMEALVIQKRFRPLFTEAEITEARRRLDELGYDLK